MSFTNKQTLLKTLFIILGIALAVFVVWLLIFSKMNSSSSEKLKIPPKTMSWEEASVRLGNPALLVAFVNRHFSDISDIGEVGEKWQALEPAEFYRRRQGTVVDYAAFSAHILQNAGLKAGVIRFDYQAENGREDSQFLVVFREGDSPKYLSFNQNEINLSAHDLSFIDLVKKEAESFSARAYRYAYFPAGTRNFSAPIAPFEWIEIKP